MTRASCEPARRIVRSYGTPARRVVRSAVHTAASTPLAARPSSCRCALEHSEPFGLPKQKQAQPIGGRPLYQRGEAILFSPRLAVTDYVGGQGRNRTTDTRIFSPLLYQLSYLAAPEARRGHSALFGRRGLYQARVCRGCSQPADRHGARGRVENEKGPCGPFPFTSLRQKLHVHAAHAAHVGHAVAMAAALFLFHQLRNHRVGGEHQASHGRGVLQRRASDLGRVDHAHLHEIAELLGLRVEAEVALVLEHLVEYHRRLRAGVVDDDAQRLFERLHHDLDAGLLVVVVALELAFQHLLGADERHTAARDDALFDRRAGRMQRILDAGFFLLHLDFGGRTNLDDRNTAGELRHALLQLLLVVVAGRLFDRHPDLLDASLDQLLVARAVDDGGVLLGRLDLLGAAEILQRRVLELEAELLADHRAARENGHVFEHRLAAVAEPRRLHGASLQDAADVIHHQRGKRLAFDLLGDAQQRLAGLGDLLQDRQQLADRRDLLVVQQDIRILEHADLLLGIVDEVRREIAAVELHALDEVELVLQRLAVLDGDHAFLADLVHRIGDDLADVGVGVGGNRADLGNLLRGGAGLGNLLQLLDHGDYGLVDAALEVHRVHAGGDELHALAHDRLSENRGRRGAVTGHVGGLGGDFLHHLRTHVLELVLQLDLLGDRDAVLGDGGRAERAL